MKRLPPLSHPHDDPEKAVSGPQGLAFKLDDVWLLLSKIHRRAEVTYGIPPELMDELKTLADAVRKLQHRAAPDLYKDPAS